jgi:hypothetical protein
MSEAAKIKAQRYRDVGWRDAGTGLLWKYSASKPHITMALIVIINILAMLNAAFESYPGGVNKPWTIIVANILGLVPVLAIQLRLFYLANDPDKFANMAKRWFCWAALAASIQGVVNQLLMFYLIEPHFSRTQYPPPGHALNRPPPDLKGASWKDWHNIVGPAALSFAMCMHCAVSQKRTNILPLGERKGFFWEFGNLDKYPGLTFGDRRTLLNAVIESQSVPRL